MCAALMNLGNAYIKTGNNEMAAETYSRAIEVDNNNADLYYNLGIAYSNMKNYELAVEQNLVAIDLQPKNANAHNALAIGYYMLKEKDTARAHARIAQNLGFKMQKKLMEALK